MNCKGILPALALCLLLTGCSWLDGSYTSITAHLESRQEEKSEFLSATNYQELIDVLEGMISEAQESGVINLTGYPSESVESGMALAIHYCTEAYPVGAYAVETITYEQGTNNGLPALAVSITYRHTSAQIQAIQPAADIPQAREMVANALENIDSQLVMHIENYTTEDFDQAVRAYAQEHPDIVMEIPQVTVNAYGASQEKVVELTFSYQNTRDDLRKMQNQTQVVFNSAVLYVSGDGQEHQKFSQLYAFLMERFPYVVETSITPAYSLLRHGVGDSRAFATVFAAMCREAGLECLTVTGTCSGEPRTWNLVYDGEQYFHLDLLACYESGGFQETTDGEMAGYVWDYSAYPPCPDITKAPAEETKPTVTSPEAPPESAPSEPTPAETTAPTLPPETVPATTESETIPTIQP